MNGIIKVSPEKLKGTAGEFSGKASELNTITNEMLSLVAALSSNWEGAASTAYRTKFAALSDDMNKMYKMIQEHSTDLTDMATAYETAETANADVANSLSGDVIV